MREQLIQLAYDALAILVPALVALGIAWLSKRLGVEGVAKLRQQLEAKQALALAAVRFAEQAFYDFDGPRKYNEAATWMQQMAARYGLQVTEDEIKGLIESALRLLKDEFAEQWARQKTVPAES